MCMDWFEGYIKPRDLPFTSLRVEVKHVLECERVDANAARHDDRFRARQKCRTSLRASYDACQTSTL